MNFLFSLLGLILGVTCLLLVFILWRYKKTKIHLIWLFFNLAVAIWGFGAFLIGKATTPLSAIIAWRLSHIGVIFIATLFFHTAVILCNIETKFKKIIIFSYLQAFFFLFLNATPLFISKIRIILDSLYYNHSTGLFYPIFFFIWVSLVVWGHFELFIHYRKVSGVKRNQILYFFVGTLVGFLGGITNFFPMFKIDIYPFGNFTIPLYCLIVTYAILKHHLMDIRVAITRVGIFFIVYAFVLGLPFWIGYQTKNWFIPTFSMFILATVGPLIYRYFQKKAENVLLAQQRRYQYLLLEAGKGMVREHDLDKLLELIVDTIKRLVKVAFVGIFLEDKEKSCYTLRAIKGYNNFPKHFSFVQDNPLIRRIRETKASLSQESISYLSKESFINSANLIIPFFRDSDLLGFLALGEKEDRTFYTQDDINTFEILSRQVALAIEYCLFLREFRRNQEKLFTTEKLAAIGGMASGIAHQMRNRLNHFSGAAGELVFEAESLIQKHPELKQSHEYLIRLAKSITGNVKRTAELIKGILDFTAIEVNETSFSTFSLKEVVNSTIIPLKVKHDLSDVSFVKEEYGSDDTIYSVKGQVVEIIFNIVDNAYEAIDEKRKYKLSDEEKKEFVPFIEIKLIQKDESHLIEVSDNGVGIEEEDKLKVFSPYFTTKSSQISGTGIGMYVVKRLVEEKLRGRIWFESEYMKGTKFFVELPREKEAKR